jgi:hypothetical protein
MFLSLVSDILYSVFSGCKGSKDFGNDKEKIIVENFT